jgi:hypothetical protein
MNYKDFLFDVAAHFMSKEKAESAVTEAEFVKIVASVFKQSVIQFCRDSKLMRTRLPIHAYKHVKRYELEAPEGFNIIALIDLLAWEAHVPHRSHMDTKEIVLRCCPHDNTRNAWQAEVALCPNPRWACKIDDEFGSRYYNTILACMIWKMSSMRARDWWNPNAYRMLKQEYMNSLFADLRSLTDTNEAMTLKRSDLVKNDSCCNMGFIR